MDDSEKEKLRKALEVAREALEHALRSLLTHGASYRVRSKIEEALNQINQVLGDKEGK